MAYLLDDKKDLGSFVIPEGSAPLVSSFKDTQIKATFAIGLSDPTKYTFPAAKAPGAGYVLKDVLGNGVLTWELASSGSSDPCKYGTNYNITMNDCAIEIVSDTYTTVTLPTALGSGGKIFLISRASNTGLNLLPQIGEKIDEHNNYIFPRKFTRLTVMSNNSNMFYIV